MRSQDVFGVCRSARIKSDIDVIDDGGRLVGNKKKKKYAYLVGCTYEITVLYTTIIITTVIIIIGSNY